MGHEYGWSGTTEEGAVVLFMWWHWIVKKVGHRSIRCEWWVIWVRKQVFPPQTVGLRPNIEVWKVNSQFKSHERKTKLLRQSDTFKSQNVNVMERVKKKPQQQQKMLPWLNHLSHLSVTCQHQPIHFNTLCWRPAIYQLINQSWQSFCLTAASAVKLQSAFCRRGEVPRWKWCGLLSVYWSWSCSPLKVIRHLCLITLCCWFVKLPLWETSQKKDIIGRYTLLKYNKGATIWLFSVLPQECA